MRYFLFFILIFLVFAFKKQENELIIFNKEDKLFPNIQAIKDTLDRFNQYDSIFYQQDLDFSLCIDKFEGKKIGIVSSRYLYVFFKGISIDWELIAIDSNFNGSMYRGLSLVDINGDGYKDIKGQDGSGGHGVSLSFFAIYNPTTKTFKYNPWYCGGDVALDKKTNMIYKNYEQPFFTDKERFLIVGDSLEITDKVFSNSSYYSNDGEDKHIHTSYKDGKIIAEKVIEESVEEYLKKIQWYFSH